MKAAIRSVLPGVLCAVVFLSLLAEASEDDNLNVSFSMSDPGGCIPNRSTREIVILRNGRVVKRFTLVDAKPVVWLLRNGEYRANAIVRAHASTEIWLDSVSFSVPNDDRVVLAPSKPEKHVLRVRLADLDGRPLAGREATLEFRTEATNTQFPTLGGDSSRSGTDGLVTFDVVGALPKEAQLRLKEAPYRYSGLFQVPSDYWDSETPKAARFDTETVGEINLALEFRGEALPLEEGLERSGKTKGARILTLRQYTTDMPRKGYTFFPAEGELILIGIPDGNYYVEELRTGHMTLKPRELYVLTIKDRMLVDPPDPLVLIGEGQISEVTYGEVRVQVLGEGGKALPGVEVVLSNPAINFKGRTKDDGETSLSVPKGNYRLILSHRLHKTEIRDVSIEQGGLGVVTEFQVQLSRIPAVFGKVTSALGPLSAVDVVFVSREGKTKHVTTDSQGRYSFAVTKGTSGYVYAKHEGVLQAQEIQKITGLDTVADLELMPCFRARVDLSLHEGVKVARNSYLLFVYSGTPMNATSGKLDKNYVFNGNMIDGEYEIYCGNDDSLLCLGAFSISATNPKLTVEVAADTKVMTSKEFSEKMRSRLSQD